MERNIFIIETGISYTLVTLQNVKQVNVVVIYQ